MSESIRRNRRRERTGRDICLQEHLSGGHEEGVRVRVETGGINHELHVGRGSGGREELISRLSGTALGSWVCVREVAVDVPAADETADDGDGAICHWFRRRVPPVLLHGEEGRIVEPLAILIPGIGVASTGIEDTDGFAAVVVADSCIVDAAEAVVLRTNCAEGTDGSVSAKGDERTVGHVHTGRAEDISDDIEGGSLVSRDVPDGPPGRVIVYLGLVALCLVENVNFLRVANEHLGKRT